MGLAGPVGSSPSLLYEDRRLIRKTAINTRCKSRSWGRRCVSTESRLCHKLYPWNWFFCHKMHLIPWAVVSIKEQGKGKNCWQNSTCSHGSQCPGEEDSRGITILDAMPMLYSGRNAEKTLDSQNRICICWFRWWTAEAPVPVPGI